MMNIEAILSRKDNEKGSVAIEAITFMMMFLMFFVFLINIMNLVLAQTIIQYAINQSAKEISQYSFIIYRTGLQDNLRRNSANAQRLIGNTNDLLASMEEFSNTVQRISSDSTDVSGWEDIYTGAGDLYNTTEAYVDYLDSNWKQDGLSLIKDFVTHWAEGEIAERIVQNRVNKHLNMLVPGGRADNVLKQVGVVGGVSGIDCSESQFYIGDGGDNKDLIIIATYTINYKVPFFEMRPRTVILRAATALW